MEPILIVAVSLLLYFTGAECSFPSREVVSYETSSDQQPQFPESREEGTES